MDLFQYKNRCRICFKSHQQWQPVNKNFNIFSHILEGFDTVDKIIFSLFAIKLNTHGALPQQICRKCLVEVENVLLFRESLVQNERILLDALNRTNHSEQDNGLNSSGTTITIKTENDNWISSTQSSLISQSSEANSSNSTVVEVKSEILDSESEDFCIRANGQPCSTHSTSNTQPSIPQESFLQNFNLVARQDGTKPTKKSALNHRMQTRGRSENFVSRYGLRRHVSVKKSNNNNNSGCECVNNNNNNGVKVTSVIKNKSKSGSKIQDAPKMMSIREFIDSFQGCDADSRVTVKEEPCQVSSKSPMSNFPINHSMKEKSTSNLIKNKESPTSDSHINTRSIKLTSDLIKKEKVASSGFSTQAKTVKKNVLDNPAPLWTFLETRKLRSRLPKEPPRSKRVVRAPSRFSPQLFKKQKK